jgi:WD40 repeat protein
LKGHDESVNLVLFSSDGRYLASGSDDKTIKLWNVDSKREITTLKGHKDYVRAIAFSPDCKYLASGSED